MDCKKQINIYFTINGSAKWSLFIFEVLIILNFEFLNLGFL